MLENLSSGLRLEVFCQPSLQVLRVLDESALLNFVSITPTVGSITCILCFYAFAPCAQNYAHQSLVNVKSPRGVSYGICSVHNTVFMHICRLMASEHTA